MLTETSSKAPTKYITFVNENSRYTSGNIQLSVNYNTSYFTASSVHSCFSSANPSLSISSISMTSWYHADSNIVWTDSNNSVNSSSTMAVDTILLNVVSGKEYEVFFAEKSGSAQHSSPLVSYVAINGAVIYDSNYSSYISTGFRALGDVNGDGIIGSDDVSAILAEVGSSSSTFTPEQQASADYDLNGQITVADAIALNAFLNA